MEETPTLTPHQLRSISSGHCSHLRPFIGRGQHVIADRKSCQLIFHLNRNILDSVNRHMIQFKAAYGTHLLQKQLSPLSVLVG